MSSPVQRVVLIEKRKKNWRAADDWLTLLYAILGSLLAMFTVLLAVYIVR